MKLTMFSDENGRWFVTNEVVHEIRPCTSREHAFDVLRKMLEWQFDNEGVEQIAVVSIDTPPPKI